MFDTKRVTAPAEFKADGDAGALSAVFSTFGVVDQDGDVLTASAFTDGQPVPMVWAHDWSMPIGKGVVKVEADRAVFNGRLWLDTFDGEQAYKRIKAAGDLQEYSWGFSIKAAEPGVLDERPVRYITSAEVFEVSPVLVGANRETYTLSVKDAKRHLNRQQLDRIVAVILEALSADELVEEEAISDDGKAADPVALLKAYTASLKTADDDALLEARVAMSALLSDLGAIRGDLETLTKRAELIGSENPRELHRQFQRLTGLYGQTSCRRAG
jgi:HK97 family phage prohead protease